MTRSVPNLYTDASNVKSAYFCKQFLRFGGLALASLATAIGAYESINNQCNENALKNCIVFAVTGLALRAYSSTIQVFRASDGKRASLKDIVNM
jgi:hypothetical protein